MFTIIFIWIISSSKRIRFYSITRENLFFMINGYFKIKFIFAVIIIIINTINISFIIIIVIIFIRRCN